MPWLPKATVPTIASPGSGLQQPPIRYSSPSTPRIGLPPGALAGAALSWRALTLAASSSLVGGATAAAVARRISSRSRFTTCCSVTPPKPRVASRSSVLIRLQRRATRARASPLSSRSKPSRPSSRSSISVPRWMLSSRWLRLYQARMRLRAVGVATKLSQSRLGWAFLAVITCTKSPFCSGVASGQRRSLMRTPWQWLPTSEWMR